MVKGDERLVEDAFVAYLEAEGWSVQRQVHFLDVYAKRGNEELLAEVKGLTGASMNVSVRARGVLRTTAPSSARAL